MMKRILTSILALSLLAVLIVFAIQAKQPDESASQTDQTLEQTVQNVQTEEAVKSEAEPQEDQEPIVEQEPVVNVEPVSEAEPEAEPREIYTFTDCNETVYATSSVNLRSGPSTGYDKVGSMGTGESVTRTGIGTGDFESWSRVQLSDGSIVYVSSNYISTTKPSSSTQSKGSNTQTNGNNGQTSTSSGGTSNNNGGEPGGEEFIESLGMGLSGLNLITDGSGGIVHNPDA